jgi:hypothetical protein
VPLSRTIDCDRHVVVIVGTGTVTACIDEMKQDPRFRPEMAELVDVTRVTGVEINGDELRIIAEQNMYSPESRRALLVSNDLLYGLGRMYEAYCEIQNGAGIRIFRTRDEAQAWIMEDRNDPPVI